MELRGRKVTVMGLGRFGGGLGATLFLVNQGAVVTVTDLKSSDELQDSVAALNGLPVSLRLGEHRPEDFKNAALIVVSPAVPKSAPMLAVAKAAGVPLTSELNLFLERCSAPIVAVTGSAGKSTTSTLLALGLAKRHRSHFGGNIGRSLLADLPQIRPTDRVCLEMSSFQLEDAAALSWSPRLAVVTNLSPNHLDHHGTMADYGAAKQNILRWQTAEDRAVLSADDAEVATWGRLTRGRVYYFSVARELSEGAWLEGDRCVVAVDGQREETVRLAEALRLPGRHNAANFLAAALAARLEGVPLAEMAAAAHEFTGLPHRLALVGEVGGVAYYNDSKATSPAAAAVALNSFERPVIAIAGGYDKKIDLAPLADSLMAKAKVVLLIGQTAGQLESLLKARQGDQAAVQVEVVETLDRAMTRIAAIAQPGDVVLLSPGHASWGQYQNYEQRGDEFAALVTEIEKAAGK